MSMTTKLHSAAYALLALILIGLGWQLHGSNALVEQKTEELTTAQQQIVTLNQRAESAEKDLQTEKLNTHTVIVTVTKPDGTKTTTETKDTQLAKTNTDTKTNDSSTQTASSSSSTSTDKKTDTTSPAPDRLSRYSVSLWREGLPSPTDWHPNVYGIGARLGDLPVWAEASWNIPSHAAAIGLRIEFN